MRDINLIAVDLGASSGRIVSGKFTKNGPEIKEIFRFGNRPVHIAGGLYWDYMKLFQDIKYGLNMAENEVGALASFSVDTWGVDYGLLSRYGEVVAAPHSYRDQLTTVDLSAFGQLMPAAQLFQTTGVYPQQINSNLQLFSDLRRYPEYSGLVAQVLLMPDFMNYLFSGIAETEYTIASTTGLLNAEKWQWDIPLMTKLGIPTPWFGKPVVGGRVLGPILPAIREEMGLTSPLQVVMGPGHDTAAGLLAVPLMRHPDKPTAFLSSGTWSIMGIPTKAPITNDTAFANGLTNEGAFDGSNLLLKNLTGLWIIQELQREWSLKGDSISFERMTSEADHATSIHADIDTGADVFAQPGGMSEKIHDYLISTLQPLPKTRGELIRLVLESIAYSYRDTLEKIEEAAGVRVEQIAMFGGGIQNRVLVQLTADVTGLPVITGPIEGSATGNLVAQLQVQNMATDDEVQEIVTALSDAKQCLPTAEKEVDTAYRLYKSAIASHQLS